EVIEKQIQKLEDTKKANALEDVTVSPAKDEITFDEFAKLDIRVGTILEAQKVKKSKKLLKMKVDTGIDQRTVLSGIAEHYSTEEVIGQQVSILVNLAPRKIMGQESQGMILMAEDLDGKLRFVQPSEVVKPGSGIS
ncbi:MAG: methionine--tRNA ligase subunit beta, partial [Fulvivirga sp.]